MLGHAYRKMHKTFRWLPHEWNLYEYKSVQEYYTGNSIIISSIAVSDGLFQNGEPTLGKIPNKKEYNFFSIYTVVTSLENSVQRKMV